MAFRDVAIHHADSDAAVFAAQLYLEALNVLGSSVKPPRPSCFDDMTRDVPRLMESHCSEHMKAENTESCAMLARIECDLQRTGVDKLMSKASAQNAGADYERAAAAYLDLWNKRGKQSTENKLPTCGNMDQVLHNAARAFQAAHLLAKAISVWIRLPSILATTWKRLARQAVRDIGQNYQAIAVYDEAASYYERYARRARQRG